MKVHESTAKYKQLLDKWPATSKPTANYQQNTIIFKPDQKNVWVLKLENPK